ncbi:MAG: hypothetical protein KC501_33200 [Myxococcales bacterium]|nr:hypothetical protein [Myxococcales bacterium]
MRARIAALALGLGSTLGSPAGAWASDEPAPPVELRWQAPSGCPTDVEVGQRLAVALGGVTRGPTSIEASIEAEPAGYVGTVVLRGPWGQTTRELRSRSCGTLADAVVLLASVSAGEQPPAVVPEPELEPAEAEPEPNGSEITEPPPRSLEPSATVTPAESSPVPLASSELSVVAADGAEAPRRLEGSIRAEARLGGRILPGLDAGAGLALGLGGRWWRAELGAAGWLPRRPTIAPGAELELRLWTAEARGCVGPALRRAPWLRPLGCAGLEVGALRGEGLGPGLAQSRVAVRAWVAGVIAPGLVIRPWRHLGLVLGGALVLPVRNLRFTLDGQGEVYRTPVAAGRGFAGVEVFLP